jgi:hypothetical protein
MSTGEEQSQKRSVKRCLFVASAEVNELGSATKLVIRTSELSIGGCYLDTINPFPEGTTIHCRILRDNGVFESKAKVVYSNPGFGMGVAFISVTPDQRTILEDWLADLVIGLKSAR